MTSDRAILLKSHPSDVWQVVMSFQALFTAFVFVSGAPAQSFHYLERLPPTVKILIPVWLIVYAILGFLAFRFALGHRVALWAFGSATWLFFGIESIASYFIDGEWSQVGALEVLTGMGFAFRIILWHRQMG